MNTYFIRHTKQLDIDKHTIDIILKRHLIAIHFPFEKSLNEKHDSKSINPDDYHLRNHKEGINTFKELASEGGYVCAEYWPIDGAIVGKINPGTKINLLEGRWGSQNRTAILKTLPLTKIKHIRPEKYLVISSGRPRQGTIKVWRSAKNRIKCLVEDKPLECNLSNLSPTQQEVLCSEYLRHGLDLKGQLPTLESFLLPVGRTLIDVDIVGLSADSKKIYAQVTYNNLLEQKTKLKFDNLKKYASKDSYAIFFCQCEKPQIKDSVIIYPLQYVFDVYCKSDAGKRWFKNVLDNEK